MRYLFLSLLISFLYSCGKKSEDAEQEGVVATEMSVAPEIKTDTSIHYTYTVFAVSPSENNPDNGFGFEITSTSPGGMKIRQETIPAVQGNHPFMSEENAASTAELMIYKLDHGIVPPAVSTDELDSIGVVY